MTKEQRKIYNHEYKKEYRKNNRDKRKVYRAKYKLKIRNKYLDYKKTLTCKDCGIKDFRVIDFDHIKDNKKYNVSEMILRRHSWKKILTEINKCEPVCSNCHRIRTYNRLI